MAKAAKVKRKKITLKFETAPGSEVFVSGSFNQWSLNDPKKTKQLKEDKKKAGNYSINLLLPKGEHEYKFFCDGRWYTDPKAETHKQNVFGSFNSVVSVG